MALISYDIKHIRGDTFVSPKWLFTDDKVPTDITETELLAKIASGEITPWDLSRFDIKAQLRATPNAPVVFEFPFTVDSHQRLGFTISHTMTETFENNPQTMVYDIQFTETATDIVSTLIRGTYSIVPDVTYIQTNV